ncbi:G-alpha-domain-containing protein [Cristinia sonorae]|uniref:G-alpha-domain-containing protein n=1 Tax=Cristinia sonorae TaxID=1940300 RepID=A0A8K0UP92_9AGAR|nr:G-alpha-domain-containing protein [Cristinia sonorae]
MASSSRSPHLSPPGRRRSISDPLDAALRPPENESPEQRAKRLQAEEEAKRRSQKIDQMLQEGERQRRKRKTVKVLLLGQSESGKSTTLKQFQLLHAPADFHAERIAWRFVIYLNLLRSVRRILDAIAPEPDTTLTALDDIEEYDETEPPAIIIGGPSKPAYTNPQFENYHRRLAPLGDLETRLIQQLSDPEDNDENEATRLPSSGSTAWTSGNSGSSSASGNGAIAMTASEYGPADRSLPRLNIPSGSRSSPASPTTPGSASGELAVPTSFNWRKRFALGKIQSPKSEHSGELQGWWEDPDDPVHVLNKCAPVIIEMWRDPMVKVRLQEKRLRLEESSGFYLDEVERIAAKMYFPTDEDVLKARLKTTGVVEHTFTMGKNSEFRGVDWKIYDVGGARPQRHAWAPYFDDVNAIIFLAPISAFDQVLAEDPRINRMEDSLHLWNSVISNKLLANVNIILFLNKCDLLKAKLESGVRLVHHMPAYRDRPNDYDSVSNYFRNKFGAVHQSNTPNRSRELFIHFTSVTDTRRTRVIIYNVRDMILSGNLRSSALM